MNVDFRLRAYVHLDRLQPQFAAYVGAVSEGDPAVESMSSLYVEMSPANWVFPMMDSILKTVDVRPGAQIVEREYGSFEVHGESQAEIIRAGEVVMTTLNLPLTARVKPTVVSEQVITNVHPRQAQILNKQNRGTMIVGGQSLFVLEVEPAAYITLAANEAEKAAPIYLNHLNFYGKFGRVWLSGSESDIAAARQAALSALATVQGA